jgi:hypothetical protein
MEKINNQTIDNNNKENDNKNDYNKEINKELLITNNPINEINKSDITERNTDEDNMINQYKKSYNSNIDFSLLKRHLDNLSNKSPDVLQKKIIKFKEEYRYIFEKKIKDFKEKISLKFINLREKFEQKFNNLENNFHKAEERIASNNIENKNFNNITVEDVTLFFKNNITNNNSNNTNREKELENLIYLVKKNSDQEKIKNYIEDIETILYTKIISNGQGYEFNEPSLQKFNKDLDKTCAEFKMDLEITIPIPSIQKQKLKNFSSSPLKLKYKKDITDKLQKNYTIDGLFCAYTTYDGISYVAWGNSHYTLEIYDLMLEKIIKSIVGFHAHIYSTRHFFDKYSKKDYLLTTTLLKSCKIFDCKDFSNILTLNDCHNSTYMYSGLIIFDTLSPENPFVITSAPNENLKVWDFEKKLVKTIESLRDYTYFLNVWYDDRNNENNIYIINANGKDVKIYNYRSGKLLKSFNLLTQSIWHMSACVRIFEDIPCLFESDGNGNFNVWDIDSGTCKKKINVKSCCLRGICIWDDEYAIVASSDKCAKIINYKNQLVEGQIDGHNNVVCSIEKIFHPLFGESIITGSIDGKIKIYSIENK